MKSFRFIHTSDLHLGRRFGNLPEEIRGRLMEARHAVIGQLASAARRHGAAHIFVAGDVFDSETPSDAVRRQALQAMAADPEVQWWLLPGNHDNLAAEALWERVAREAAPNVHPLLNDLPVDVEEGVVLLPAPVPRRYPGRDLTGSMAGLDTDPRLIRIGLAHGAVADFGEELGGTIPPDRDRSARLDYLALGDWHGRMAVSERTRYSGTPEYDRFRHDGRGACLAVAVDGAGAKPTVEVVQTGAFRWSEEVLPLVPGEPVAEAFAAILPPSGRRDTLLRIRAQGRARLQQQNALRRAADEVAPEFGFFELDTSMLLTEYDDADLDEIGRDGALRLAAGRLFDEATDGERPASERDTASAALRRLYGYLRESGE